MSSNLSRPHTKSSHNADFGSPSDRMSDVDHEEKAFDMSDKEGHTALNYEHGKFL